MRRREFIAGIGGVAAWPLVTRAQERNRVNRLGFLIPTPRDRPSIAAFFDELRIEGFIEGQNLEILPGGFDVRDEQIAELATALVKASPDAIVAGPERPLRALQNATRGVPLIGMSEDLVGEGLVSSLARPGANITGISLLSPELDGKRQDILIEAVPGVRRIAVMFDSKVTPTYHLQTLQHAARSRGVEASVFGVMAAEEIGSAINAAKTANADCVNFLATPLFSIPGSRNNQMVLERVTSLRLPAIFQWPETAELGALLGYGPRFTDMYRQRARIVAKIFRGAKPAEIPVEQPIRFELAINLKTARTIGNDIPSGLLARADKVIE